MGKDINEVSLDLDNENPENVNSWRENAYDLLNLNYTPKEGYRLTKVSSSHQVLWIADDTTVCSKVTVCHNDKTPVLLHLNLLDGGMKKVLYFASNQEESSEEGEDEEDEDVEMADSLGKWKQVNFQQFYVKVNRLVQQKQVLKEVELSIRSKVESRKFLVNNSCELLVDVYVPNLGFRLTAVRDGLSDIWRSTSPYRSCITVFIFPRTNYSNVHLVIEDRSHDVPTKTDLYFKRSYLSWEKISKQHYFTRFENEFGKTGLNRELCDINVNLYCYYYKYIYLRMDEIDPDMFFIEKTYCDKVTNFAVLPKPGFFLKEVYVDNFLIKCSSNETVLYTNLHFYQDLLLSFYLIVSCNGSERVLYFMKKDTVWSVVNFSQYISSFSHFSYYRTTISRAISVSSTKSSSRSSSFNIVRKASLGHRKKLGLKIVHIRKLLRKSGNLDDNLFHGKIFTSSFRNKNNLLIRTYFSPAENCSIPKRFHKGSEKEKEFSSNRNVILSPGIGSSFMELFLSTNTKKLLKKTNFVNLNPYTNFTRDGKEKTPKGGIGVKYYKKYSEIFNNSNFTNDNLLDTFKTYNYYGSLIEMLNKLGYNVYGYDLQSNGLSEGSKDLKCYLENYEDNMYDLVQFVKIVKNNKFFDSTQKYKSEELFSDPEEPDLSALTFSTPQSLSPASSLHTNTNSATPASSLSATGSATAGTGTSVNSPSSISRFSRENSEYVLIGFSMGANISLQAIKLYNFYNSGGDPLVDKFISICGMYNIVDAMPPLNKKIFPPLCKLTAFLIPKSRTTGMKHRNYVSNFKRFKEFNHPYFHIFKHRHLMCNQILSACKNSLMNLDSYPKDIKTLVIHSNDDPTCHINGSNALYENIESDKNTYVQVNSNYHHIVTYEFVGLLRDIFQKTLTTNYYYLY